MSQVGKINLYDSTSGGGTPQLKLFTDSSNKQNITAATNLTLTTTSGNINFVNSVDTTKNITDVGGVISTAVATNTTQGLSLASTVLIANSASASNATQSIALSILEINKSVDSVVYVSAHYNGMVVN